MKVPYVTAGDFIAPPSPTELEVGVDTAGEQNRTNSRGKNAMCSLDVCRAHRHLSIFYLKRCSMLYLDSKNVNKIKIKLCLTKLWSVLLKVHLHVIFHFKLVWPKEPIRASE